MGLERELHTASAIPGSGGVGEIEIDRLCQAKGGSMSDPLLEATRAVALAKLVAFEIHRKLATLVGQGVLKKNDTIDRLVEIASANGL